MSKHHPMPNTEIGARYNHWTVLDNHQRIGKASCRASKCICDCGTIKVVSNANLIYGLSKCCRCSRKTDVVPHNTGDTETRSRLYQVWYKMLQRCNSEKDKDYRHYGGRGITVCDEWALSFQPFKKWALENGYAEDLKIDRIDVNGNYEPSNCRWATQLEQANNMRTNKYISFNGKTQTMTMWAREVGLSPSLVSGRLRGGWSVERALTEPVHEKRRHEA